MYYTPLANYSVSDNNPIRASARPPMMADMTAISPTTGELMVPGNAGVVIQAKSGDNAIRVSGTATTTAGLVSNGTTANQIQFFSNGNITAAFDSRGLYLVDDDWINIGSGKIVIYTGAGNLIGNLVIGSSLSGTKVTGGGVYNTFIGQTTGQENTTGQQNTFVGYGAGRNNTIGANNTNFGVNAGQDNTTGNNNTNIGQNAGIKQTGSHSVYIGAGAGGGAITGTGSFNQCIGVTSGLALTTGSRNNFIGTDSGKSITSGSGNQFIGHGAGQQVTTGDNNVGIGHYAGGSFQESTASRNTSVGAYSSERLTTGQNNTIVGYAAGAFLNIGDRNTIIGKDAGYGMTTGVANVCIGEGAGNNITTGMNNIYIGQACTAGGANVTNETVIGSNLFGRGSATTTISGNTIFFTLTGDSFRPITYIDNNGFAITGTGTPGSDGRRLYLFAGDNRTNKWELYVNPEDKLIFKNTGSGYFSYMTPSLNGGLVTVSDIRAKHNIKPLTNGLSIVTRMNPVYYNYRSDTNNRLQSGLIAQELLPLIPEAVDTSDPEQFGIDYVAITPYLINSIQEQQIEITSLKTLVSDLQVQLSLLKSVVDTLVSK